jgi:Holliday junction resolvasome RuvABC endonuclease subunit
MGAVVGVDPSISSTGVFVIGKHIRFERVQSRPGDDSLSTRLERLRLMALRTHQFVIDGDRVDLVVMEGPAYGSNNQMTHMLAGFWWLLAHALEKTAPVAVVQPGTLKKFATGDGRADKDAMLAAAIGAFPGRGIKNNDVADAAALAAMGAAHLGREFGGVFAPSGAGSVHSVRWPELRKGASK